MKISNIAVAVSVSLASLTAHAGVIVGGSTMLDNQGVTKLETWLGQGSLTFTNIFTKQAGNTARDFHAAADGKGATFVLMRASEDGGTTWKTVGGYDPLSWSSSGGYNITGNPVDWTGFLFNLTDAVKKDQTTIYQTYNTLTYGPTFGGGHDLYTDYWLTNGYSSGFSYGGYTGKSIVDGSNFDGYDLRIGALEVFTVAPYVAHAVPEPGSIAILGLGLAGLAAARRKQRQG